LPQEFNGSQPFPNTQTNVFSWLITGGFKLPVLFITCDSVMKEMALFLKVHVMKRDDYSWMMLLEAYADVATYLMSTKFIP